ncbi:MAG: hydroxymethylbilane synthase [Schwartzia succinivorans]|jgi:hydroxymethylbilane synthase|nr:hydroxymethylbilane synthase [Schwartzia succinivorans]
MKAQIIIGTRGSKLALWQADYVEQRLREEYPGLQVTQKRISTKGDRILDVPLAKIGGKGLFTKELEEEMLSGSIDLAVHSLKDMPAKVPDGLMIAAVTKRLDPGDALVSNRFSSFSELPQGARVGTSSLRRRAQLLCARPDLTMIDLRGNVNTRLRKLDEGEYDAIVLAVAGLKRLGFAERIREVLPQTMVLPAVGQGALAIETRADDKETRDMLAFLRDDETICCAEAERSFLARVEGGCQVPVGVYATAEGDDLKVEAVIASLDGRRSYRGTVNGAKADAAKLGKGLAEKLLNEGGAKILQELGLLLES